MSRFINYLNNNWDRDSLVLQYEKYMTIPYTPQNIVWLFDGHIEDSSKSKEWNRQFVEDNHKAWIKERKTLKKRRENMWKECQEMIRFYIWDSLDQKLSDNDVDRLFIQYSDRFLSDGFRSFISLIDAEIAEIKEMDWFKDIPDSN